MESSMTNARFLESESIYLRPFCSDDAWFFVRWMNHAETRGRIGESYPTSRRGAEEYIDRVNSQKDRLWLAVVRKSDDKVIGETGLLRMYHPWRTADMTIIIPDPEAQGAGCGTEAVTLMLDYAFGYLGLHRIAIGVVGFNHQALSFYRKIGFWQEGVQEDGYYWNHQFHDFIMMRMLEDEYREKYLK